ncbi:hypothetical protein Tco_0010791 [Tanacetum coccineum]
MLILVTFLFDIWYSTDANIKFIGSSKPQPSITQAQPVTIINPEPIIPQREGKGIATDEHVEDQRKLVLRCIQEEKIKKAEEEAKLFAISKPEVIKVVREEAKKLGIDLKEAITTKFALVTFGYHLNDEQRKIIPRKKNAVVQDLMNSLSRSGMEAPCVHILVAASKFHYSENARFNMKLKKLIDEHPDLEKLKSKKVKLEALGYEMN